MKYSANGTFVYKNTVQSLTTGLPGKTQSLTTEHFNNSIIEKWSADNLIYTTDGNVGIGIRNPKKKLDINGDIKANNLCIINDNGNEECINFAFILLAKELILGSIPKDYRDFDLINRLSKDDIIKYLLPKNMSSNNQ